MKPWSPWRCSSIPARWCRWWCTLESILKPWSPARLSDDEADEDDADDESRVQGCIFIPASWSRVQGFQMMHPWSRKADEDDAPLKQKSRWSLEALQASWSPCRWWCRNNNKKQKKSPLKPLFFNKKKEKCTFLIFFWKKSSKMFGNSILFCNFALEKITF